MKIITRLQGGIGNQFFQYAIGRSLANRYDGELILDDSLLKRRRLGVTPRDFELGSYNICGRKLQKNEESSLQFLVRRPFRYLYSAGIIKSNFTYYREPHFTFDSKVYELAGDLVIDGYWQSERYFLDISDKLRQELQPINTPHPRAQVLLDQIHLNNSVSLHVRRGDYISNPKAAANHIVCDLSYYRHAVSIVAERVLNPIFYVFSDDPAWVEKELKIDFPLVIVSQPQTWPAYEDLRLMSHCNHHIIANSSFSWWGAWLNPNQDKIVIAPSRWFRAEKNTNDLIPAKWIRL